MTIRSEAFVRIGLIGAGRWGPNLLRGFHTNQDSAVVRVVDTSSDRLKGVTERYPDIGVSTEVADILDDPTIDAVVIATPASTHFELGQRALRSGKHVFMEKPLVTDSGRAVELINTAEHLQRNLAVGHVFLHNPAIIHAKRLIDEGSAGQIQYVTMLRTNLGPIRQDVNVAWDLATHDISIVNYWLGTGALTASARGGRWLSSAGREDAVFATLTYPDGVLVNLELSWLHPLKQRFITVVGDSRMFTVDDMVPGEPIRIHDKRVTKPEPDFVDSFGSFQTSIRDGDIIIPRIASDEPVRAQCAHFVACVQRGVRPVNDGRSALPVLRTLEAMDRSMAGGGRECPVEQ